MEIIGNAEQLRKAGVTEPPGLEIDGVLIMQGTVPSLTEMKKIIAADRPDFHGAGALND